MTVEAIKRSIRGALLLLRNDPDALAEFDISFDGFWRSFQAALLAVPFELAIMLLHDSRLDQSGNTTAAVAMDLLSFLVTWVVFPLLAIATTRFFNLQHNYVAYVVVGNWVHLVQIALVTVLLLIFGIGIFTSGFWLLILLAMLVYDWIATKRSLETTNGIATSLVVLNAVAVLFAQTTLASLI